MKYILMTVLLLVLSNCSSTRSYYDNTGKEVFVTKCPGNYSDYSMCYNRAHKKCGGKGYNIKGRRVVKCMEDFRDKPMLSGSEKCNQLEYQCK